jgi:hypothetical protein
MSSQLQELLDGAKTGRWILPSAEEPNPVSLARAIAAICGVPEIPADPVADQFHDLIGEPRHLIFVIADGFGMNFVKTLDEDSFCRSNLALESRAVFPGAPLVESFGRDHKVFIPDAIADSIPTRGVARLRSHRPVTRRTRTSTGTKSTQLRTVAERRALTHWAKYMCSIRK